MKKMLYTFLLFLIAANLFGQSRGFRAVKVKIGGNTTTLYHQSHALVIGMSNYTNGWNDLDGVSKDVVAVKSALEQNGFNVIVKENMTKTGLDKAFTDFIAKYGKDVNNRLVFYFAGHGFTVATSYGDKLGYIVPIDAPNPNTDKTGFQAKALEMAQIEIYAKRLNSKHALFLFDACFAGSLFAMRSAVPAVINYKTKEPVRQFITSGSANEQVPDVSIFRKQFVKALTTLEADANNDGYLTGTELGTFLQDKVVNYSYNNQHPQYGKIRNEHLDKGDFVFVLNDSGSIPDINPIIPSIGTIVSTLKYGSISLESGLSGDLYLDGKKLGNIGANSRIPINKVITGSHTLEIQGSETWKGTITVYENRTAAITAKSSGGGARINANYTVNVGSLSVKMRGIGGGSFTMGSSASEAESNETPHTVRVGNFAMMRYEVTQKLWKEIMGTNPSEFKGDNLPVEKVSWNDVQEFIKKFNTKTGGKWRLPTEVEWEYAAKGGESYKYAGSSSIGNVAWYGAYYSGNSAKTTNSVGSKSPNGYGLYDMTGNVWEWCSDYYDSDYYSSSPTNNPENTEKSAYRVVRGGSWFSYAESCRVAYRGGSHPTYRNYDLGFRLVTPL